MTRDKRTLLQRVAHAATALIAMPLLMGADGKGCASGGQIPVGTEPPTCGPTECDRLPRTLEAKVCADGAAVGRSVCATKDDGTCFWDFPACPAPSIDAGMAACTPQDCEGLGAPGDAKLCADGSSVSRSVCVRQSNGACGYDFPPCPSGGGACAPTDCDGKPTLTDLKVCPNGQTVGRSLCSRASDGSCANTFPPCPPGVTTCTPKDCAGQPVDDDAKVCQVGPPLSRTACVPNTFAGQQPNAPACTWDFPPCPVPPPEPQGCGCLPDMKWGPNGGEVISVDSTVISSCVSYSHERKVVVGLGVDRRCTDMLAGCGANAVGAGDIWAALQHPDVQAALGAAPVLFGRDTRPVDGSVFRVVVGASTVEVGAPCDGSAGCKPVPPGVNNLVEVLRVVDQQQLTKAPCNEVF